MINAYDVGKLLRYIMDVAKENELSIEPYTMEDLATFSDEDLRRIAHAQENPFGNHKETRFFFTIPLYSSKGALVKMCIEQKIVAMLKRNKPIDSYVNAKSRNRISEYFSGINGWPKLNSEIEVKYAGDISVYYEEVNAVLNYHQAVSSGRIEEYMSGVGIFPEVLVDYKTCWYNGDYEEYISKLSVEEYFVMLRRYSAHVPARFGEYDDCRKFYQTAMCQVTDYIKCLEDLPSPVYVPGDGIGIGSYVLSTMNKVYYSCEPNDIGKEGHLMGLISSRKVFDPYDMLQYKSVFFGNCFFEIAKTCKVDMKYALSQYTGVVVIYEDGCPDLDIYKYYGLQKYSLGHNYKHWRSDRYKRSVDMFRFAPSFKNIYEKSVIIPMDVVSYNIMRQSLSGKVLRDVYQSLAELKPLGRMHDDFERSTSKVVKRRSLRKKMTIDQGLFGVMKNAKVVFQHAKNYSRLLLAYTRIRDLRILSDERLLRKGMTHDASILHVYTNSYLNDAVHGRPGTPKIFDKELVYWYPGVKNIYSAGLRKYVLKTYDALDVIEDFVRDGTVFATRVVNPYSKRYIRMAGVKYRVFLINYDLKTNIARYKLVKDLVYNTELEVMD